MIFNESIQRMHLAKTIKKKSLEGLHIWIVTAMHFSKKTILLRGYLELRGFTKNGSFAPYVSVFSEKLLIIITFIYLLAPFSVQPKHKVNSEPSSILKTEALM